VKGSSEDSLLTRGGGRRIFYGRRKNCGRVGYLYRVRDSQFESQKLNIQALESWPQACCFTDDVVGLIVPLLPQGKVRVGAAMPGPLTEVRDSEGDSFARSWRFAPTAGAAQSLAG
jgi:hypothetical protein